MEEATTAVCQWYGYRLDDIYGKSFKSGGLTRGQIVTLYTHAVEREIERLETLYGPADKTRNRTSTSPKRASSSSAGNTQQSALPLPRFEAPETYAHLSKEQREQMTRDMMGKWKQWADEDRPTGGKGCRMPT